MENGIKGCAILDTRDPFIKFKHESIGHIPHLFMKMSDLSYWRDQLCNLVDLFAHLPRCNVDCGMRYYSTSDKTIKVLLIIV